MKRLLLDMDGVIADFHTGMCNAHMRPSPYNDPVNYGQFDMAKIWKMSAAEFWSKATVTFWKNLPVMPLASNVVSMCVREFGIENICLLSSPASDAGACMAGKHAWIQKHFPEFKRQFLFGPHKEFCSAPNHYLVDDCEKNTEKFKNSFLVPRPWNSAWSDAGLSLERLYVWLRNI